ncbi:cytoplasmic protein [Phlyctochytrium arcticum]|nr:cytoplasmic protein [Phlyctochytrium arcticum]
MDEPRIPVTVFTGFLGAGKTTCIISLIKRLPKDYNVVLLKNEFGDVAVDSELAKESNIAVTEMLNNCLCCVLVGQMKNALEEIKEKMNPSRIIIEASGTAFPAPIAWQIRQIPFLTLDAIVTVVDCINFKGYDDVSVTAKMQAQYTDLIMLNKHEDVSEHALDTVIDRINDLNTDTPKIKVDRVKGIDPELVFGIDSALFALETKDKDERDWGHLDKEHMHEETKSTLIEKFTGSEEDSSSTLNKDALNFILEKMDPEYVYRIKGIVRLSTTDSAESAQELFILNWAFGRHELTPITRAVFADVLVRLNVIGIAGMESHVQRLKAALGV